VPGSAKLSYFLQEMALRHIRLSIPPITINAIRAKGTDQRAGSVLRGLSHDTTEAQVKASDERINANQA